MSNMNIFETVSPETKALIDQAIRSGSSVEQIAQAVQEVLDTMLTTNLTLRTTESTEVEDLSLRRVIDLVTRGIFSERGLI
jgi:hypothetical protein